MKYEWKYFFNIVVKYLSTHASEVKIDVWKYRISTNRVGFWR